MNVYVYVSPGFMFPELKLPSNAVTVWGSLSLFVQITVLLTPMTTVMLSGLYPVAYDAAPRMMLT